MIAAGDVTLRPWERADVAFVFDACQDAEIQRWTTLPTPYTALDAVAFIDRHARPQPEDDGAFFAIIRTDTGEVLGSISFNFIDWAFRTAEAGYWVAPDARGQNIAATALAALVEWGRRCLDLLEVRLVILPGNAASERVAARAGFVRSEAGDAPRGLAFIRLLRRH